MNKTKSNRLEGLNKKINEEQNEDLGKELEAERRKIFLIITKFDVRDSFLPAILGAFEQLLYISVIVLGFPNFILIWLGVKTAGIWKVWADENDRLSYNTFVIGNALSLIFAFYWSIVIRPELLFR